MMKCTNENFRNVVFFTLLNSFIYFELSLLRRSDNTYLQHHLYGTDG